MLDSTSIWPLTCRNSDFLTPDLTPTRPVYPAWPRCAGVINVRVKEAEETELPDSPAMMMQP